MIECVRIYTLFIPVLLFFFTNKIGSRFYYDYGLAVLPDPCVSYLSKHTHVLLSLDIYVICGFVRSVIPCRCGIIGYFVRSGAWLVPVQLKKTMVFIDKSWRVILSYSEQTVIVANTNVLQQSSPKNFFHKTLFSATFSL